MLINLRPSTYAMGSNVNWVIRGHRRFTHPIIIYIYIYIVQIAVNSVPSYISAGRNITYYLLDQLADGIRLGSQSGKFYVENDTLLRQSVISNFSLTMYARDITEANEVIEVISTVEMYLLDAGKY